MKRKTLLAIIIPAVVITGLILYSALSGKEKEIVLETKAQYGQFQIAVMITGELQAIRETEIKAPSSLRSRNLRIHRVKIQDLIPEGTVVDSGDWVATLDRSEADNTLKDILDNLEKQESEYMRTKLDTTMQLRSHWNNPSLSLLPPSGRQKFHWRKHPVPMNRLKRTTP